MAETSDSATQPPTLDTDYRRLFRENPPDDSSTDQDDLADDAIDMPRVRPEALPELDVIGFSISRAQTLMKSPETPAVEKIRVIEDSGGYFNDEPTGTGSEESASEGSTPSQPTHLEPATITVSPEESSMPAASSQVVTQQQPRRSAMMRSILGETDSNRRRANSGPTMLGTIKKILPDLPSVPYLKPSQSPPISQHTADSQIQGACHAEPQSAQQMEQRSSKGGERPRSKTQVNAASPSSPLSPLALDGNVESLLSPTSPQSSRRMGRSNSESSLYLKRKPTAASAFDDTSAFPDVREMNNARFKAITDSFQNSTLRMPRLPMIKYNARPASNSTNASGDEQTQQNTRVNTGSSSPGNNYHYTNIPNIRKSKKLFEVENSQQRAHPVLSDALENLTGDLVIMGGYRGSILRDAKPPHRQLWAPVKVGLNLRNADLEVGLTREDEENAYKKVFPSGTLSHIGPIDICRRLLKHAKKCPNTHHNKLRVHDWGYDWRLSPDLLGQRLIEFLEGLKCNRPETPPERRGATIIAHSLGGCITRWAINRRPELFAGVVYAGVPQHCVNILGPLRNGDDVLLSSKVLTAQVNFTMRTSYALLPENGRCFINKHTNERYDLNFFDAQTWDDYCLTPCINPAITPTVKDHRKSIMGSISESISNSLPSMPSMPAVTGKRGSWFGGNANSSTNQNGANSEPASETEPTNRPPLTSMESTLEPTMQMKSSTSSSRSSVATACTIPLPVAKEYLARTLADVIAFKNALVHKPELQSSNRYPPLSVIFGKTVPTVYGARVLSRDHIKYTDAFDDLAFASGDGVVLASSAQLPEGYRCVKGGRVETDRGHVGLLGDLEGVGQCLNAVIEARQRGVGMGCYDTG